MAVVAQGWKGPSFKDQNIPVDPVRCLIVGGVTKAIFEHRISAWGETGFAQRFLWCFYKLRNPRLIGDSIESGDPIELLTEKWGNSIAPIPFFLDDAHKSEIRDWVFRQPGTDAIPYSLLLKIAAVLRWHYERIPQRRGKDYHMTVLREFSLLFRDNEYAELDVEG